MRLPLLSTANVVLFVVPVCVCVCHVCLLKDLFNVVIKMVMPALLNLFCSPAIQLFSSKYYNVFKSTASCNLT